MSALPPSAPIKPPVVAVPLTAEEQAAQPRNFVRPHLSGVGPPTPATGVLGNYYLDTTTGIMYGPKVVSGWGAPESAFPTFAPTGLDPGPYTIGNQLAINAAGRITALRFYRDAGVLANRTLQVWSDAGTLLTSVETNEVGLSSAGWYERALVTPLAVSAGQQIVVSYDVPAGKNARYAPTIPSATPHISFVSPRWITNTDTFPSSGGGNNNYAADVVYQIADPWPPAAPDSGPAPGDHHYHTAFDYKDGNYAVKNPSRSPHFG